MNTNPQNIMQVAAPPVEEPTTQTVPARSGDSASQPGGKRGGGIKKFAVIGTVVLFGFLGWRMLSQKQQSPTPKATTTTNSYQLVQAATVKTGTLQQTMAVTGSLKANLSVNLSAKVTGRIAQVLVDEGSQVRKGQLLVTFEDDELRSQVSAAEAAVQTDQVQLRQKQLQLPATSADIETSIQDAQANLASVQAKYRQTRLREPAQEQTTRAAVETARQSVSSAQTKLAQSRETVVQTRKEVEASIAQNEAAVQGAQASVQGAQAALDQVKRGSRAQEIAQAQQDVSVLEAQLANAQTAMDRSAELVRVGASAQSELDTARTQRDVYKAQLEAAKQALSLKQEGSTNEQIRQAQETVRQTQEAVRQAQSALDQARAKRSTISNAQRDVTNAQTTLATAQSNLRTAQANLSNIPVTRQDTQIALQAVRQAQAAVDKAKANRADVPVAREDIEAARSNVRQAQETLSQARIALANARVVSPIDGVVNTRSAAPGQASTVGGTLMNLVATNSVYFEAQVDENSVRDIHVGQSVRVMAASISNKPLDGTVMDVIAVADAASRQFRVRVSLDNSSGRLTPGAFARGQIIMQSVRNALIVPDDAVREEGSQKFILVVNGTGDTATTEKRIVHTSLSANGQTQLLDGVENGTRVVVGNPLLKAGNQVRISAT